jgi:hypothetical protein
MPPTGIVPSFAIVLACSIIVLFILELTKYAVPDDAANPAVAIIPKHFPTLAIITSCLLFIKPQI